MFAGPGTYLITLLLAGPAPGQPTRLAPGGTSGSLRLDSSEDSWDVQPLAGGTSGTVSAGSEAGFYTLQTPQVGWLQVLAFAVAEPPVAGELAGRVVSEMASDVLSGWDIVPRAGGYSISVADAATVLPGVMEPGKAYLASDGGSQVGFFFLF